MAVAVKPALRLYTILAVPEEIWIGTRDWDTVSKVERDNDLEYLELCLDRLLLSLSDKRTDQTGAKGINQFGYSNKGYNWTRSRTSQGNQSLVNGIVLNETTT